jgi:uncharacterized C2H2 Zn-finger protein
VIKRCLFLQCLHNVTNSAYLVKLNPPQFYLSTNCHMKKSIFRIVKRPLSTPPPSLNCSSCPAHFMFRYELGQHVKKTHLGLPDRPPWVKRCPKCTFASSLETEVMVHYNSEHVQTRDENKPDNKQQQPKVIRLRISKHRHKLMPDN